MIPLLLGITALSRKGFNTYGAICFLEPNNPPHCVSSVTDMTVIDDDVKSGDNDESDILWSGKDFAIPCGRGIEGDFHPLMSLYIFLLTQTFVVIVGTTMLMDTFIKRILLKEGMLM